MKYWFTSDTHFGSERTLQLSRRPFKNVQEMNNTLINKWNSVVGKDDIVYHLGDFGDYKTVKELNGKVILIEGNYELKDKELIFNNENDSFEKYLTDLVFKEFIPYLGFSHRAYIDDKLVFMAHEPSKLFKTFDKENDIQIFGHIHEKQMIKRFGMNVGVDCHNFTPIDIETIKFYTNALLNFYDEEVFM